MTTTIKSEPVKPAEWDPAVPDREYFREGKNGDRGYLVRRNGVDCIRLDRPMEEILKPKTDQWVRDEYGSLLLKSQITSVAFAADRAMCAFVGLHQESRVTWQDLTDKQRIEFTANGPPAGASVMRRKVYEAIFESLKPFTRDVPGDSYNR